MTHGNTDSLVNEMYTDLSYIYLLTQAVFGNRVRKVDFLEQTLQMATYGVDCYPVNVVVGNAKPRAPTNRGISARL